MSATLKSPLELKDNYRPFGYIIVVAVIVGASVLLPMRTLTVPPNDFMLIAWSQGQQLLQHGAVDLTYPYPLGTQILLLPFVFGSPELGAQLWFVCSLLLLAASIVVLMDSLNWPRRLPVVVLTSLLVGAFGPVFTTLWLGQLNFVSLLSLALLIWALKSGSWLTAGSALGLGLIKPQLTFLVVAAVFALAACERHWKILIGFGMVIALLVVLSAPFVITTRQLFGGGVAYHLSMYLAHTSTLWGLSLTLAPHSLWLPALLCALLILWLAYLWVHAVKKGDWVERASYLIGVTTIVNLLVIPYSWFYNQAVLIVPICHAIDQLRRLDAWARVFWLVTIVVVVYFLPTAVDVALTRPYSSEVYQVIPVICLLPLVAMLQSQVERNAKPTG
jgi:Glycosyltransferase family 87